MVTLALARWKSMLNGTLPAARPSSIKGALSGRRQHT
jgi:hypothetical protein